MCAEQSSPSELRQQVLRSELKVWEHAFAEANGGRKAGKEDIRKAPDIASKYREYNKLRAKHNDAHGTTQETPPKSRKRKHAESPYTTAQHPAFIDPYDVPQSCSTTPRIMRTSIGPTPQKNGQVLGLFDMLSPYSTRTATPSKSKSKPIQASMDVLTDLLQTPSRRRSINEVHQTGAFETTPSSSAKRRRLELTQTPSSLRQQVLKDITPISNRLDKPIQPCLDQTPAFLKRFSDPSVFTGMENELGKDITYSPPRMRLPRKPVGRSLSQLVRSLREQEDEKLDEELALMRELETGEAVPPPKLLIQDSQIGDLPLGADGDHNSSEAEAPKDNAEPRRSWKKKGQKRTTRRANIGVNRAKWKPEAEWGGADESDDGNVPESQAAGLETGENEELVDDPQHQDKTKLKSKKDTSNSTGKIQEGKKLRMINPNATSHANFRSLKLRNKNTKGRKGGRFGRR